VQGTDAVLPDAVLPEDVGTPPPPPLPLPTDPKPQQGNSADEVISQVSTGTGFTAASPKRAFTASYTVRTGGALLAFCAGIVNAVSLHELGVFVSHMTGTFTKLGVGLESELADASRSALLLVSFVTGSTVCGFFIGKSTVHFGLALYDFGLLSVACLLVVTTVTAEHEVAMYTACAACGLQNGLATNWAGAVVRTTHVTGLFTDLGLLMGRLLSMFCRNRCGRTFDEIDRLEVDDDLSKLSVLGGIALGFLVGVFTGNHLFWALAAKAFLVPAGITGSIGLAYSFYRVFVLHQHFFSSEEMEVVDLPEHSFFGPTMSWQASHADLEHCAQASDSLSPRVTPPGRRLSGSLGLATNSDNKIERSHSRGTTLRSEPVHRDESSGHLHGAERSRRPSMNSLASPSRHFSHREVHYLTREQALQATHSARRTLARSPTIGTTS